MNKYRVFGWLILLVGVGLATSAIAQNRSISVTTGVDFYNRYVWRGMDIANTPSIQPSFAVACGDFELGVWGAYTLSNDMSESDEIDLWLGYTHELPGGASFGLLVTDYYFPNAGVRFFNFNNHDAVKDDSIPDPGAHLIELGGSFSGPASFPIAIAAYINVYNEAGNNTYFQIDYPVSVNGTDLTFFCGAAGGSQENPGYYGTDAFAVINLGVSASREMQVSESFSIPLTMSFILNPRAEISYLTVAMSF